MELGKESTKNSIAFLSAFQLHAQSPEEREMLDQGRVWEMQLIKGYRKYAPSSFISAHSNLCSPVFFFTLGACGQPQQWGHHSSSSMLLTRDRGTEKW